MNVWEPETQPPESTLERSKGREVFIQKKSLHPEETGHHLVNKFKFSYPSLGWVQEEDLFRGRKETGYIYFTFECRNVRSL